MLFQTQIYVAMRIDLVNQKSSGRRTSRSSIEKHGRWDGWRYHCRQRYRSLVSHYTGRNAEILVEKWNRFSLTLWWKVTFKPWCSSTQKRNSPMEMHHKVYSSPEPQRRTSWQKLALFILHKLAFIVLLVDWCARIRQNVRISLLEKESSTGSTLLTACGATSNQ